MGSFLKNKWIALINGSDTVECLLHSSDVALLLLVGDSLLRAFSGPGIILGVLSTDRQTSPVTDTAIAADLLETLDVHRSLSSEITFYHVLGFDDSADASNFFVCQVLNSGIGADFCLGQDLVG